MKEKQFGKIWTKSFVSISLTQFLMFTVFYALLTTLPIYVINHLGGSQSSAGLVVTSMLIAAILIRPFSAKILDVFGKKKGLLFSIILFTLTTFFYTWMNAFIPLLVLRFVHGISFGIASTATPAIAAHIIPKSREGEGMGYFAMAMNLAIVAGPFISLTLLQFASFQTLFMTLNVFMIIGMLLSFNVRFEESPKAKQATNKLKISDLIEVKALPLSLISGLVGFAYATILSFVSVYAEEIGLSSTASYFFLVFAILMIVSRPYLGRAFDERGPKFVMVPSLVIFAAGLVLLGFTTSALVLLLSAGLIGLGYGSLLPGFQTMAIQTTSHHRSSHAISTFFIFYDTGIAAGASIWGLISAGFGFESMYIMSAILVVITALILNMYLNQKEKSTKFKQANMIQEASNTK